MPDLYHRIGTQRLRCWERLRFFHGILQHDVEPPVTTRIL